MTTCVMADLLLPMELTEKGYGEKDVYPLVYAIMHRVGFFVFPDHQILGHCQVDVALDHP